MGRRSGPEQEPARLGVNSSAVRRGGCFRERLNADTQLRTQELAESSSETMSSVQGLREVIEGWPTLSAELRAAVLAVTRTARR